MKSSKLLDAFPPPKSLAIPLVGLSISDSAVRFIELGRKRGVFYIAKHLEKPIPPGVVSGGSINNPEELAHVLESIKKELKIDNVKVSISEENAYLFTAKLPEVSKDEIVSAIESKIEENVPVSPSELLFDYKVFKHTEKNHLDVIVCASPIKSIESYNDVLRSAGLNPISIEIESQAISKALLRPGDPDTVLIVNFGYEKVGLYVVRRGVAHFSSTVPMKKSDLSPEMLLQEIKKLYMYWHTLKENADEPKNKIEKIIICGDSPDESIMSHLASHLDVKVEIGNVWVNVFDINHSVPEISFDESLKYPASVGLAISEDIPI